MDGMWSAAVVCLPLPLDRMCTAIRSPLMTVRPVSRTSTSLRAKR
jgi:hypothetical protein